MFCRITFLMKLETNVLYLFKKHITLTCIHLFILIKKIKLIIDIIYFNKTFLFNHICSKFQSIPFIMHNEIYYYIIYSFICNFWWFFLSSLLSKKIQHFVQGYFFLKRCWIFICFFKEKLLANILVQREHENLNIY
jgi:hypothetical protein